MEDNCDICCICGCEDNEDLEDLVPCACESSEALVHTSCAAACTTVSSPKFSSLGLSPLCIICGGVSGIMQNGGLGRCQDDGKGPRGSKRSMSSTEVAGVELKRQRMSSPDSTMQVGTFPKIIKRESNMPRVQIEAKDVDCSKMAPARQGWHSANVPAVVPFKKRRIQIVEVPRSPSPPPKQSFSKVVPISSPGMSTSVKPAALLHKSLSPKNDCYPHDSPSLTATSLLPAFGSPTSLPASKSMSPAPRFYSPNKMSPESKSPSTKVAPEQSFSSPSPPRVSSPQQTSPLPRTISPKPTFLPPKLAIRSPCPSPSHCPKQMPVETSEQSEHSSLKALEQGLMLQLPGTGCEGFHHLDALTVIRESHVSHLQSSRCFANRNQHSSSQEVEDGELIISTEKGLVDFEAAGELPEVCSQEARGHYAQFARPCPGVFHNDRSGWDLNTDMDTWDNLSNNAAHARKKMLKGSRTVCETMKQNARVTRQVVTANAALEYSSSKLLKGEIDIDEYEECNSELLALSKRTLLQQNEELGKLEIRDNHGRLETSASWKGEEQGLQRYRYATKLEDQASSLREEWKELAEDPEGEEHIDYGDFDCRDGDRSVMLEDEAYWRVEDTMDDPFFWESKTISDGGGSKWKHGHLIEPSTEKCSTSGRVKSSGWDQLPEGFDSAEEALKAAQVSFSCHGRRYWANSGGMGLAQGSLSGNRHNSRRDEFRDSSSRFGDRCIDEPSHRRENYNHKRRLDNGLDDYNSAWGRGGLRRGGAGVHARGCFNGWSDNQQSRSLGQWGPRRHRSSSGFSSQGAAAVAAARVESSGFVVAPDGTISRGGRSSGVLQSTFDKSRVARGSHTNRQFPLTDLETGPLRHSRMDRHMRRNIETDVGTRQGGGPRYAGRMSERWCVLAGHGNVDRYGKSTYSCRSGVLRRSESPHRLHPSDQSYPSRRTACLRSESRVTRSRLSPPSLVPYGLSKTFLGKSSPPPFPKWSHNRREADNFREREFKHLAPRSYGSSGRISPHVVHGSSLMDERDWRVLASTRSFPGVRGGLNSSIRSGKSMDGSAELYQLRRMEEEENTHSISKDSDHSRNSPKEVDRIRGSTFKNNGSRDDDKNRESYMLSSRSTGGCKRAGSRDGDNDLPQSRHRSSW